MPIKKIIRKSTKVLKKLTYWQAYRKESSAIRAQLARLPTKPPTAMIAKLRKIKIRLRFNRIKKIADRPLEMERNRLIAEISMAQHDLLKRQKLEQAFGAIKQKYGYL